jgi:hypothetical protein
MRAMRSWRLGSTGALALAVGLAACATPYDPFRVPAPELRERVHTIALAPLQGRAAVVNRAHARREIEPLVTARLRAGGFEVVGSEEMERLWLAAAADVGEVFDPVTGELDRERYDAVERAVYHELRSRHAADAVLWLTVEIVDIHLAGPEAAFCGTSDAVYWPGGATNLLRPTLVRATCLATALYDMEERELYGIRAGLETVETYAWQTRAVRPVAERLRNPLRVQQAVESAIGPLANER